MTPTPTYSPTPTATPAASRFTEVQIKESQTLTDITFLTLTDGWVVGTNGYIGHSTDGGATWTAQRTGSEELRDVDFVDMKNGWVIGTNGVILRTSNGGSTWTSQAHNNTWWTSVDFVDANNGWVAGDYGTIERTSDGGNTWKVQYTHPSGTDLWGIYFYDVNNGWAVGENGLILHTTNGGTTWSLQTSGTSNHMRDVYALSANTAWAVSDGGDILYTKNGGDTWTPQVSGSAGSHAIRFTDPSYGIAAGYDAVETNNGGVTWTKLTDYIPRLTGGLSAVDSSHVWFVAGNKVIRYVRTSSATPAYTPSYTPAPAKTPGATAKSTYSQPDVTQQQGSKGDFTVDISPRELTVNPGETMRFTLTVSPTGGFNEPVEIYVKTKALGMEKDYGSVQIIKPPYQPYVFEKQVPGEIPKGATITGYVTAKGGGLVRDAGTVTVTVPGFGMLLAIGALGMAMLLRKRK